MNKSLKEEILSTLCALRIDIAMLVEGNKPLTMNDEDELIHKINTVINTINLMKED